MCMFESEKQESEVVLLEQLSQLPRIAPRGKTGSPP